MRLTKDGHSILLIGSMHIGIMDPSRTKEINALLKETGSICMEDDAGDIPGAQRVAQAVFGNPPGQRLRDRLGDALYDQSKNQLQWYLAKGGAIDDISPYAVASLLTMNMPAMRDFTLRLTPQQSLDAAIRSAAVAHGQQLLTIESSDAVPAAFARLTEDEWALLRRRHIEDTALPGVRGILFGKHDPRLRRHDRCRGGAAARTAGYGERPQAACHFRETVLRRA